MVNLKIKPTSVVQLNGRNDWSAPWVLFFGKPYDFSDKDTFRELGLYLNNRYKVRDLYAPNPSTCNAKIASAPKFGRDKSMPFRLFNGVSADGSVMTKLGQAIVIKSADCPTIVVWNKTSPPKSRKVVVAHGGRNSLLDWSVFEGHSKSRHTRTCDSVVSAIIGQFKPGEIKNLSVHTVLGIGGADFKHSPNHPNFWRQNRAMIEHVEAKFGQKCFADIDEGALDLHALDLHALIRAQFELAGVKPENIRSDTRNTFADVNPRTGSYRWNSQRRDGKGRNAVVVLHSLNNG